MSEGSCWEWEGTRDKAGYGKTKQNRLAHRETYRLFVGDDVFKPNLCVLHKCDNPPCVNPEHLYQGTQKDNARDRQERGRNHGALKAGQANRNSRFTLQEVRGFRKRMLEGESAYKLAKEIGCTKRTMSQIRDNKHWVDSSYTPPKVEIKYRSRPRKEG